MDSTHQPPIDHGQIEPPAENFEPPNDAVTFRRAPLTRIDARQLRAIIHHYEDPTEDSSTIETQQERQMRAAELREAYQSYLKEEDQFTLLVRRVDHSKFAAVIDRLRIHPGLDAGRGPPFPRGKSPFLGGVTASRRTIDKRMNIDKDELLPIGIPSQPPVLPVEFEKGGANLSIAKRAAFLQSTIAIHPSQITESQYRFYARMVQPKDRAARDEIKRADTPFGSSGIVTQLEVDYTDRRMKDKTPFMLPRTSIAKEASLDHESYSRLSGVQWLRDDLMAFFTRRVGDYATRTEHKTIVLLPPGISAGSGGSESVVRRTCKGWSNGHMSRVDAVICPYFFQNHWILVVAEPRRGIIRTYNGLQGSDEGALQAATFVGQLIEKYAGMSLNIKEEFETKQNDFTTCGPIALAQAALFAKGMKLRPGIISPGEAEELRAWIAFQLCCPGDLDENCLRKLTKLGVLLDYPEEDADADGGGVLLNDTRMAGVDESIGSDEEQAFDADSLVGSGDADDANADPAEDDDPEDGSGDQLGYDGPHEGYEMDEL